MIICTDGLSNLGIGTQDGDDGYKKIGIYAKDKGVTVHIVTFNDTECNINAISLVAGLTNGEIKRVDTNNMS